MRPRLRNILLYLGALLGVALEITAVAAHIFAYIPIHWGRPIPVGLQPERELNFYLLFLVLSACLGGVAWRFLNPLNLSVAAGRQLRLFCFLEGISVALIAFCFFKWVSYTYPFYPILSYENPTWLRPFFYAVLAFSLVSKIFFVEVSAYLDRLGSLAIPAYVRRLGVGIGGLILLGLLWPKASAVLALNHLYDGNRGLDTWSMRLGIEPVQVVFLMVLLLWGICVGYYLLLRRLGLGALWAAGAVLGVVNLICFSVDIKPLWLIPSGTNPLLLLQGMDNWPVFKPLQVRQFLPFFLNLIIPIYFLWHLIDVLSRVNNPFKDARFYIVLAALAAHAFSLSSSMIGAYRFSAFFLMALLGRDAMLLVRPLSVLQQRVLAMLWLLAAALLLLTNRVFVVYPGIFNPSATYQAEQRWQEGMTQFAQEAAMIKRLTRTKEQVLIVADQARSILNSAGRQSYHQGKPLYLSRIEGLGLPGRLNFISKAEFLLWLGRLQDNPPHDIFIGTDILAARQGWEQGSAMALLLDYVDRYYLPLEQAGRLQAFELKGM